MIYQKENLTKSFLQIRFCPAQSRRKIQFFEKMWDSRVIMYIFSRQEKKEYACTEIKGSFFLLFFLLSFQTP